MPRSAPLRLGISAATVRPGMRSAWATISAASPNCGMSFAGTKEQTSISGMPAAASAVHHAVLSAVGMNSCTLCNPSRMPTSRTQTSIAAVIVFPFSVPRYDPPTLTSPARGEGIQRLCRHVATYFSLPLDGGGSGRGCLGARSSQKHLVPSLALEHRLALLIEGTDALVAVSSADQSIIGLDLEEEAVFQIHLQAVMDRLLRLADRQRRIGADRRRRREHRRHQFGAGAQPVDDTPLKRLRCAERPSGQDDLLGAPLTDRARQKLGPAGAGHDAERHLGERETRLRHRIG